MIPIVPALIPKTAREVREVLPRLRFSPEIHLDVVDGKFVPFTSWPYEPQGSPDEVRATTDTFTLEVDLMVEDPETAAAAWVKAGADMLVFHVETLSLEAWQRVTKEYAHISCGISALNDTPLETLLAYAAFADGVQLMGIAHIGAQGQPFDERVLERTAAVKKAYPGLPVTIDGGVNTETIARLAAAGMDRCICGSAIVAAEDPYLAHQALATLISSQSN
jgi:ribulose-phosphate 3-epimerase